MSCSAFCTLCFLLILLRSIATCIRVIATITMYLRNLQYTLNKRRSLRYNDPLSNTSMYSNEEKSTWLCTLFRDLTGPYQRALWVKFVLYTHIITFVIKSNWKLSQNPRKWTPHQYVHFQGGVYWPKPLVLASSSTSISSKWNILSEFFIFYTKASTSALATILCPIMCGSKWPIFKVCK